MIVTFSCPVHSNITMFGDVAVRLLELMGHSGTVPGAILAEDVQAALERLEAAVASGEELPEQEPSDRPEDDPPRVSLRHRALPLIDMLKSAAKEDCNVMWDSNR